MKGAYFREIFRSKGLKFSGKIDSKKCVWKIYSTLHNKKSVKGNNQVLQGKMQLFHIIN